MTKTSKGLVPARLRAAVRLLMAALLLFAATGCMANRIVEISDNSEVQLPELVDKLKETRVVFVGESHDSVEDHRIQLEVIRAMHEAGADFAIGMEMFRATDQHSLDEWIDGKLPDKAFKDVYYSSWHMRWSLYSGILEYAKKNRIPIVGLNVPDEIIHQVFKHGFKSLTPDQLKEIPPIECDIDDTYRKFIKDAMGEHVKNKATFDNFCEAQMVWDSSMGANIVKYLDAHPDKKMVVLAGGGHAWKRGIPRQVEKISKTPYLVIMPSVPELFDEHTATSKDADYLWIY